MKTWADELAVFAETIKVLNNNDALELTLTSALSFVQVRVEAVTMRLYR